MKIKKYIAKDFKDAIQKAKAEMGSDAIILQTRQVKKGGILGIFSSPQVEITVVADENLQVNRDLKKASLTPMEKQLNNCLTTPVSSSNSPEPNGSSAYIKNEAEVLSELQKMKNMITEIKSRMYDAEIVKDMPEQVRNFYKTMVDNQVQPAIALNVVKSVVSRLPQNGFSDLDWAQDVCLHTLQESINPIQPIQINGNHKGMVVFMVGSTGVGKTTTIAKLAANLTFMDNKEVALITLDTYRISAAEQLKTYADIIGIPISIVFTPDDLVEAINKYQDKDIIFVDTAGRSPYNQEQMQELQEFVQIANPDETILVLSVTTDSSDIINIYDKFKAITVDKLIFTKLDETTNYGPILNALYEIQKPLAYFTTGQNVPDDIEIPDSLRLAQMLLRKDEAV